MLYLALAILCSASIALIFNYSEGHNLNRLAVTTANYFMASLVSLYLIWESRLAIKVDLSSLDFIDEFKSVISRNGIFSTEASIVWAIAVGIVAGFFFFASFIYYQRSVKEDGASLSGCFAKLGILVPMALSLILWNEIPTLWQWIGILLSIIAILVVNLSFKELSIKSIRGNLILLFLLGGLAEFSNKIFQQYAESSYKGIFLFSVFFTAFLISLLFTVNHKQRVRRRDLLIGLLVGIPNLFSSFFLIMALDTVKTSVAFPIFSAATILVINLGGYLLFGERLNPRERISVLITVIALVLINF